MKNRHILWADGKAEYMVSFQRSGTMPCPQISPLLSLLTPRISPLHILHLLRSFKDFVLSKVLIKKVPGSERGLTLIHFS